MLSIVMGIDHGNGAVKALSEAKDFVLPAGFVLKRDLGEDSWEGINRLNVRLYESNRDPDEEYCWGKDITKAGSILSTYTKEQRYSQFTYQLLSEFILAELLPEHVEQASVQVITGCPSREKGTKLEDELKKAFLGGHVVNVDGSPKMIKVEEVYVLPQPLGTVLSLYLDRDGYVADESYEEDYIGVVDIGSGTTDIDGINGLKRMKDDSDTIHIGMHDVYQQLADYINSEEPSAKATRSSVEHQLNTNEDPNSYRISKRASLDIETEKNRILKRVARRMINEINGRWTSRLKFDKLILTGGGATLLAPHFRQWENDIIVVGKSQLANARGFYRYGLSRKNREESEE